MEHIIVVPHTVFITHSTSSMFLANIISHSFHEAGHINALIFKELWQQVWSLGHASLLDTNPVWSSILYLN
jgi:hypothetical protein